jgi:FkbM family methyltransferase
VAFSAKPTRVPLARLAGLARRGLGLDRLSERLDAIEAHLGAAGDQRWPHGPVYLGDHTALVATRWGAKMLVDTRDSLLAPWLLLDGLWEANVTGWLQRTLQPGQVFVDVGANIGYFTLLGGQLVGPAGRVVAIEAHPGSAELLRRNVVINGMHHHVEVRHSAAWSRQTTVQFHLRAHFAANSSVGSVGTAGLAELDDSEETVEVDAVPLDDLLAELPRVDVIKVDVEGAEGHVFTGLDRTLRANPDITVMFEWSPAQIEAVGDEPVALLDLLSSHGFNYRLMEDDLAPIASAGLLDLPYGNVLAARVATRA